MGFINKIIFVFILGGLGLFVYYVGIPYVQEFNKKTLLQQIAIEIGTNSKRPISVSFGTTTFMVDLAATNFEKERGLGGRFFLNDLKGLLFVYEKEVYPAIWMKNMIFSIDIMWLDKDFRVVHMEKNVSPSTYPTVFRSDLPAQYVLELNAGFADAHGVTIGDTLKLVETPESDI